MKSGSLRTSSRRTGWIPELEEDFRTAWVPDVLDRADFRSIQSAVTATNRLPRALATRLVIPKPDSTHLVAFVLPPELHLRLHDAVESLRDLIDRRLLPGVCGYRRGAEQGFAYQTEYSRFLEFVRAGISGFPLMIRADVKSFFHGVTRSLLRSLVEDGLDAQARNRLDHTVADLETAGIVGLPPGYADARLLANLVLDSVDRQIKSEFVRWVDDYRIFASSESDALLVLDRLGRELRRLDLRLNREKVAVLATNSAETRSLTRSLESVYHPDAESPQQTRAQLRAVFAEAADNPIELRRELRFALRRLAREGDDIALDFCLTSLPALPWEAPRMVAYVARFASLTRVSDSVSKLVVMAADLQNEWLLARLCPLVMRTRITAEASDALREALSQTEAPAVWGLILRALSASGHKSAIAKAMKSDILDGRAMLAACTDLRIAFPPALVQSEGPTVEVLTGRPAPLPDVDSLL